MRSTQSLRIEARRSQRQTQPECGERFGGGRACASGDGVLLGPGRGNLDIFSDLPACKSLIASLPCEPVAGS
jgi:hypothetical protein